MDRDRPPSIPPRERPAMAEGPELLDPRPHRSRVSGKAARHLGAAPGSPREAERPVKSVTPEETDDAPKLTSIAEEPVKKGGYLREVGVIVVIALAISMVVKTFLVQSFFIPSPSMESTLAVDDRILVNKLANSQGQLRRGDIVVFVDPGNWLPPPRAQKSGVLKFFEDALTFVGIIPFHAGQHVVKRIIGMPGDRVKCCDAQGRLTVNGKPIDETYLRAGSLPSEVPFDVQVPSGSLWVMGDNRQNSRDSRAHLGSPGGGFVPIDKVEGRVAFIIYPFDRFRHVGGKSPVFADVPPPS